MTTVLRHLKSILQHVFLRFHNFCSSASAFQLNKSLIKFLYFSFIPEFFAVSEISLFFFSVTMELKEISRQKEEARSFLVDLQRWFRKDLRKMLVVVQKFF